MEEEEPVVTVQGEPNDEGIDAGAYSTGPLARPFADTVRSFACCALPASLRSAALIRLIAHSLTNSWGRGFLHEMNAPISYGFNPSYSGVSVGSGAAELEDCSTNGTMLNRNLIKRAKVPLTDGE